MCFLKAKSYERKKIAPNQPQILPTSGYKKKYKYNALGHVVFLGCDEEADRYVKELQNEFGYAVQLEIR